MTKAERKKLADRVEKAAYQMGCAALLLMQERIRFESFKGTPEEGADFIAELDALEETCNRRERRFLKLLGELAA